MASAQDLRKRIRSVKNTQQITKAMKMVASARLHKAQQQAKSTTPYALFLRHMLDSVLACAKKVESPLMETREVKKTAYLIIGADKGLAGAYTSNLMKFVYSLVEKKSSESLLFITVGRKPCEILKSKGLNVYHSFHGFSDKPSYANAVALLQEVQELFVSGAVDEVRVVYTRFINSLTYEPKEEVLLPLVTPALAHEEDGQDEEAEEYIFVPNQGDILEALLPKVVTFAVYEALLQSAASELGSRMTAMTTASDNAGQLIDSLGLEYNRLRQAQITNEISEIIGGANALQ